MGNETYQDRPDLCVQAFQAYFQAFIKDLTTTNVLGVNKAYVYSIEYQKRGGIHAHLIIWNENKLIDEKISFIDNIIHSHLPDSNKYPKTFKKVMKHMIHDPCDVRQSDKKKCVCYKEQTCSKKFPKSIVQETYINMENDIVMKRSLIEFVKFKKFGINNSDVVSYNAHLLQKYNAHINVEPCKTSFAAKYLFKYIYKGYDYAKVKVDENNEIEHYDVCRYISGMEAMFRIYGQKTAGFSHKIVKLKYHLENDIFHEHIKKNGYKSMFIEYFNYNQNHDYCRQFNYLEFATKHIWKNGTWIKRTYNKKVLSRLFFSSIKNKKRFCLRILLMHIKGPKSYLDLRTINGILYDSFEKACEAANLLNNSENWHDYFSEIVECQMPKALRKTFYAICANVMISNPRKIIDDFYKYFTEDIAKDNDVDVRQELYDILYAELKELKVDIKNLNIFPESYVFKSNELNNKDTKNCNIEKSLLLLNEKQREFYDIITRNIKFNNSRTYFIEGFAGSGKTFLFKTIINWAESNNIKYKCFAPTGLASLFYDNSSTLHSGFSLPLLQHEEMESHMDINSQNAQELMKCKFFIIEEISMCIKYMLNSIDRLLKKINRNNLLFGGKTIIFGGDFKQLACVVPKSSEYAIFQASVKNTNFFEDITRMKLIENVRQKNKEFGDLLLNIGNGQINDENECINLPDNFVTKTPLVDVIYPDAVDITDYKSRIILCPTNADVKYINELVLQKNPNEMKKLYGTDTLNDNAYEKQFANEYLNTLQSSGFPDYCLNLKIGAPIVILKNISVKDGLVNGTRGIIVDVGKSYILMKYMHDNTEKIQFYSK